MKKYIVLACLSLFLIPALAQKPKNVQFTPTGLPDELLEYMNGSTMDKDRQKENTKILKDFKTAYVNFDAKLQERLVTVYNYTVKAKMKGNPEISGLTRMLTVIATTPSGGEDVAGAYNNAPNLDGFVTALEAFAKRNAKTKAVMEFVDFCDGLFTDRLLYHSNSSEWKFAPRTPFRLGVKDGVVLVWFETPADLHYASAKDQSVIKGTTGVYDYKENEWKGNGGRLEWTRTGLGAEECYADLGRYKAETKFPKFKADSVDFVHTGYFNKPIRGRIEEQLEGAKDPEKYTFPKFRSYQRDFVIKDIMPGVDYSGSFMMNGSKFISASSKHPAKLVFYQDGKVRLTVSSMKFTITPERMKAENAAVALYITDEDSISNTGILVRYNLADKQVMLINDSKRNFYSPYIDTYHELDIYSESIIWKMDGNELLFSSLGTGGGKSINTFESSNHYTYKKYHTIKGIDEVSPVERVFDYMGSNSSEFSIQGFSDYLGLDMSQTLLMIHNLSHHGLVSYNEITGLVKVKDKLVDFHRAFAKKKGSDYDALSLESMAEGTNARMNLEDNKLLIRGVEQFIVSDSQAVVVRPDSASGSLVTVGRNRSIHFSGRIDVGRFILTVKDCDFSYEAFSFNMPTIEQLHFYVPDFKDPKNFEQMVRTPLSNLVGTLDVDKPDNHCGLKKNKEYPIFKSLGTSNVFYDAPTVQNGQYVRDRFYYTLTPFTLYSLVDFETDSLQFDGVLTSGGIFPDINQPLRVQKDYYLGFNIQTPAGGYDAYGGKGHYTKNLRLNQSGLRGSGTLTYLTSTSQSKDFLFLLDSTVAVTDTFDVREDQGFPQISNGRTDLHWLPYADSMAVSTLVDGRPFKMYRGEAFLTGRVDLMPKGAHGAGSADVLEGTLASQHFALEARQMDAESSDFSLRSTQYNTLAFSVKNVTSSVNFDTRHADIQSKAPVRSELQLAQYAAVADRFSWEMDRKELTLANSTRGTSEGLDAMDIRQRLGKRGDMPGVRFTSTDPARHQLAYSSLLSLYKYDAGELSSQGVFLINVADAAIAPDHDTLHVNKGGEMRVLNNAQVVFNRDSAFHLLTGADLIVEAGDKYGGKGYYDFHNDEDKVQRLFFDQVGVQNGITVANGNIASEASFTISSAFGFAGKVRLEGNQRWPFFEGGVRLIQPCIPEAQLGLLAYADYTDPEHVHITVPEQPTDWKGNRITASILMDKNNLRLRPAFLTNEKVADNELLSAHGILTYLGDRQQYMIADEEKIDDPDAVVSPYLALSTTDCLVEGEGPINFARQRTQASFYAYGTSTVGISSNNEDQLTTVFGFTFPIDKAIVNALADNFKNELRLTPYGMNTNAEMRHAMMYHYGADQGAAKYAAYSATGVFDKVPDVMKSTMLFDNLHWQHNPILGLYCEGKVGLVSIGDKPLGVTVTIKGQIYMDKGNQKMKFYVEAAKDHWYFFYFDSQAQELTIYSSVGTWDDQIKAISTDDRKITKEGLGTFYYHVGNVSNYVANNFLIPFSRAAHPDEIEDDEY